jgi:hypothetical protein
MFGMLTLIYVEFSSKLVDQYIVHLIGLPGSWSRGHSRKVCICASQLTWKVSSSDFVERGDSARLARQLLPALPVCRALSANDQATTRAPAQPVPTVRRHTPSAIASDIMATRFTPLG